MLAGRIKSFGLFYIGLFFFYIGLSEFTLMNRWLGAHVRPSLKDV